MPNQLVDLIVENEDWLTQRIIYYAKKHGLSKHTPTLYKPWRITIKSLSETLIKVIKAKGSVQNPVAEWDLADEEDPMSLYGAKLTQIHMKNGVSLRIFLGLLKFNRFCYLELITQLQSDENEKNKQIVFIAQLFDRLELAVYKAWHPVSERKTTNNLQERNRELTDLKNKYSDIYKVLPLPAVLLNQNDAIENMNQAALKLFTRTSLPEAYSEKPLADTPFAWLNDEVKRFAAGNDEQYVIKRVLETNNGERFFDIKLTRLADITDSISGTLITFCDTTDSHQVKEAHNFCQKLFDELPASVWRTDNKFKSIYSNKSWLVFTGKNSVEQDTDGWHEGIHPEDIPEVHSIIYEAFKLRKPFEIVYRFKRADGEYRWILDLGRPYTNTNDHFAGYIGTCFDITDLRQMEEELRKSEEKYRQLVEFSPDATLIHDRKKIYFANTAAARLLGAASADELMDKPVMDFVHPDSLEIVKKRTREVVENGTTQDLLEERLIRCDGSFIDVEVLSTPFSFQNSHLVQVAFHDISKRKKRDEELLTNSKLESLGLLAGGIAHDFNNILTIILGNLSLIQAMTADNGKLSEMLGSIEKASLEAKDLTQQLLTFAKGGIPIKKVVSIGNVLREAVLFALSGSNIRCEFFIPDNLWPVEVDVGQINQVMNNIILNAKQAMPDGGIISVRADNVFFSENNKPLAKGSQAKCVRIKIKDMGVGIPSEILPKIFDPYFTTKLNGTGLGLSTAYSIIKKHNGHIAVESQTGEGTTFTIFLPVAETDILSDKSEKNLHKGIGNILVMDDEERIREVTGEMLKHLGYTVEFAKDGLDMIKIYKNALASDNAFNAVIMDLTVPGGMGGKEALTELLKLDPHIKAIVSSGYSEDPVMAHFKEYGFKGVLAKPYLMEEMGEILRKVLSESD